MLEKAFEILPGKLFYAGFNMLTVLLKDAFWSIVSSFQIPSLWGLFDAIHTDNNLDE